MEMISSDNEKKLFTNHLVIFLTIRYNKSALEILARKERITVCRNSVNGMVLKEDAGKRA